MSRDVCPYDNVLCELNYPPPDYPNPDYPKDNSCNNCYRNKNRIKEK